MRYRVYYQQDGACTEEDFCICYADSEAEAEEVFSKYHPETPISRVEKITSLRDLAANMDEHEFLVALLEAIEDEGLEARIYRRFNEGWCPTQAE